MKNSSSGNEEGPKERRRKGAIVACEQSRTLGVERQDVDLNMG